MGEPTNKHAIFLTKWKQNDIFGAESFLDLGVCVRSLSIRYLFTTCFFSLFLINHAFASNCDYDLLVKMNNTGAENCHLIKQSILNGKLHRSSIPNQLPATGEAYSFVLRGQVTKALLTYQCGDNNKIMLEMGQYYKYNHIHTSIEAYVIDSDGVFEKHTDAVTDASCAYPPNTGKLSWTLTN